MADFTHTISVVATLDGGRSINVSFIGTIEDVYECNYGTLSESVSMSESGVPYLNMPVAFALIQCISGMATLNVINSGLDQGHIICLPGLTGTVIGPYGLDLDANAATTTNTLLIETIEILNGGSPTEFLILKTPAS